MVRWWGGVGVGRGVGATTTTTTAAIKDIRHGPALRGLVDSVGENGGRRLEDIARAVAGLGAARSEVSLVHT